MREAGTRSFGQRARDLTGIVAFWALFALLVARIAAHAGGAAQWLVVAVGAALGWPFADFMSGLVHWAGDRLGDERTPILGPGFVAPFREHHVDPAAITRHGFLETNGNNSIASLPFLGTVFLATPDPEAPGLFLDALFASGGLFVFGTNQIHKWAHADVVPGFVRRLQQWGLLLPPQRHALHHTPPFDRHYCITAGWISEPLARVRFFEGLEWIVARLRPDLLHREHPREAERLREAA